MFGKRFRFLYPLFFKEIKTIEISKDIDVIVSSSHSVAKGVLKSKQNQIHISYFQAPNSNYIWQDAPLYFKSFYPLIKPLLSFFRKWDLKQSKQPDYIICNSLYVKNWVKNTYNREATVIYPPVNLEQFPLCNIKEDFYVIAGRMATIKRFDLVIQAFNTNNKKLIVIGDGEQLSHLKSLATSKKITFLGFQNVQILSSYLQKAKGFIQMGVEGFGIAAIEAQSCGTPILCYGKGGVIETVKVNETGMFFHEQTSNSLNESLDLFETKQWNYKIIHDHAQSFSAESFDNQIKKYVSVITKSGNGNS
nr:glycosyltransferase [Flavobacterium sp. xlx-221]